MKGELKGDAANVAIRNMIAQGIEKVELRDEIYCQLIRQTTCNPNSEYCQRVWSVFSLCVVSFGPSHTLNKVRTAWNKCILMRPLKFLNLLRRMSYFPLWNIIITHCQIQESSYIEMLFVVLRYLIVFGQLHIYEKQLGFLVESPQWLLLAFASKFWEDGSRPDHIT